jgi:hypothetical protein
MHHGSVIRASFHDAYSTACCSRQGWSEKKGKEFFFSCGLFEGQTFVFVVFVGWSRVTDTCDGHVRRTAVAGGGAGGGGRQAGGAEETGYGMYVENR